MRTNCPIDAIQVVGAVVTLHTAKSAQLKLNHVRDTSGFQLSQLSAGEAISGSFDSSWALSITSHA